MRAGSGDAVPHTIARDPLRNHQEAIPVSVAPRWRAWGAGVFRSALAYQWYKRWELWLGLVVGAWLRLADLHHTLFLDDQVALLQLGQAALKDGGLPVTGIRSSIGTLNAPFSIYLYLPFAAAGSPLGAAWMIALANLVALLMTYVVVDRAFGRLAAGATLALYATSAWAVFYSSYFWQQTAVAPFLLVYLLTLYAGVVQKRKRWLVPHLIVLGLLSQLHPIMAYLLPTTLVGLALLWPRIPWKSLVIGLLCIGLLYVPTLLWELVSNWADTRVLLRHFFATSSTYDLLGLDQLLAVLRFQGMLPFGVSAAWLGWLMNGAYVLALGWLGWWVGAPLLRALQAMRRDGAVALWQVREAAEWRGALLLFIWQAAPLLLLIHRTQGYCQCYMVLFFPAPYITLGVCFAWVVRRGKLLEAISTASVRLARRPPASIALSLQGALPGILWRGALVCSLVVLLGLQALASSHLMVAYRGLDTEEASLSAGQHEAYAIGAQHTIVASSLFLQSAFAYLAEHEPGAVEVQSAESCLALPAAAALPTVVVTAFDQKESAVDKVLAALPAATLLRTLPVRDLPPDHLYRVDGSTLHLAGEQTLSQPVVADQHLALEGMVALPGPQRLVVLRWRVLQTYQEPTGTGAEPLSLLFSVQPMTGTSDASGAASTALCTPGHLQVGETLLTWFSLPGSGAALPDSVVLAALSVRTVAAQRVEPVIGPLRLVSGAITRRISQPLPLSCLSGQPFQLSCPLVLPTSPQIFIPIHRCLGDASARLLLAESAPGQFACVVWGREDTRPGAANAPYIFSAFLCQSLW